MTGQAIYEAKLDHARYLRSRYLVDYNGKGWLSRSSAMGDSPSTLAEFTLQQLTNAAVIHFEISPRIVTRAFALPGEFAPPFPACDRNAPTDVGGYNVSAKRVG